jgi:hypothetical protein
MALQFSTSHIADSVSLFRYYKNLGERAIMQVDDDHLVYAPDDECNSIATIVKHMAGNMRSRWTNFLTTDGEKPDRNRDSEFAEPPASRADVMKLWEEGWNCLFTALASIDDSSLGQKIRIRGEEHSVLQAVNRQLCHYSYHVGQIVALAKQFRRGEWNSLSVPRNKSADFNRRVFSGEASQR